VCHREVTLSKGSILLVVVAAAGCGRLGFDPIADAGGADAIACSGDLLVDTAADDSGLGCQGAGCSLRAALALANARASSTICVADGLSITVATPLAVTADVTIGGAGAAICGAGTDRVFRVAGGGALRLRDLTVCHGRLVDAPGAGVLVEAGATLDADGVVFDDNAIVSDTLEVEGGALRIEGDARVTIRRSRFTNNRSTQLVAMTGFARGGAVAIQGGTGTHVAIEDSSFEDNLASNVGGAMYLNIDAANLTLQRLLFARNTSFAGSAFDINCAATGTFSIENTTFVDNASTSQASGGVFYVCATQTVRLSFCSFRGNTSQLVRLDNAGGRAEFRANAISAGAYDICLGPGSGVSLDGNVTDRDGTACPMTGAHDHLIDPMFGALADNGGPTPTLALLPGSPARDAAGTSCPAVDQRGQARPAGADCDAGAFEAQ
jgi:hypothetical protein